MSRFTKIKALGLLLSLVMLAGCGGGEETEAEAGPDDAVKEFATALFSGDGETACAMLTTPAADRIASDAGGKTCEEAVETQAESMAESEPDVDFSQVAADATYEIVKESEDSATVKAIPPPDSTGSEQTFNLVNEDGTWLIGE